MALFVSLTGASGVGKSTLEKGLAEVFGGGKVTTITDRKPRVGESSKDYDFRNSWTFYFTRLKSWMWKKNLLWVVKIHGNIHSVDDCEIWKAFAKTNGKLAFIQVTPERHSAVAQWAQRHNMKSLAIHLETLPVAELRTRINARSYANNQDTERRIRDSMQFEIDARRAAQDMPIHFIAPGSIEEVLDESVTLINTTLAAR